MTMLPRLRDAIGRVVPNASAETVVDASIAAYEAITEAWETPPPLPGRIKVHDLRSVSPDLVPRSKTAGWGSRKTTVLRDPKAIDTIVVHQAAVMFGPGKQDLVATDGDRRLAVVRRVARTVPAHVVALQSGDVVLGKPLAMFLYHANGANARSLGIEVEGKYAGIHDDGKGDVEALTAETACRALEVAVDEGRKAGSPIRYIVAHRQTSKSRRADPGEGLWRIFEAHAARLGLEPRYNWTMKSRGLSGRPIPVDWSAKATARY